MAYSDSEIDAKINQAVADAITASGIAANLLYVKIDGSTPMTGALTTPQVNTEKVISDGDLRIAADGQLTLIGEPLQLQSSDLLLPVKMTMVKSGNLQTLVLDAGAVTDNRTQNFKDEDGDIVTD